jgi:competence protein ComEC
MHPYRIPAWKAAPFIRLIPPLAAGIILQWYLGVSICFGLASLSFFIICFTGFYFLPLHSRYRWRFVQSVFMQGMILSLAMVLTWNNDQRNQRDWFGHFTNDSSVLILSVDEPPVEKPRSFKAVCKVWFVVSNDTQVYTTGKLLVYFSRDSNLPPLRYGDRIAVKTLPQAIKNSGNPGGFNYQRYQEFQQLYQQVYVKKGDWDLLKGKSENRIDELIYTLRDYTLSCLYNHLQKDGKVTGIAEALLIGYKEDLDKDLVQAYSNTGVVHIIAISGLHLGLIYVVLIWILNRIPLVKKGNLLKAVIVIACLWLFALLTGASASVLRSAVMFTCIVPGKLFKRNTSIHNSLAASAFILLCYDPYFLWDVGFQLSYLALVGITTLQQPLFRLLFLKNKMATRIWEMLSVTIAAQITTFPVCLYYFHQFPNLFFISNLLAVPLSTAILFSEIALVCFSWLPLLAGLTGKLITAAISLMNCIIEYINSLPFSLWDNIFANISSTWVLYAFIFCICGWLMAGSKVYFRYSLFFLILFSAIHASAGLSSARQKKIIIYNVPKKRAVDFVYGSRYFFSGDSSLVNEGISRNFYLKPSRTSLQLKSSTASLPGLYGDIPYWQFFNRKMLLADKPRNFQTSHQKIHTDILLLSGNSPVSITELQKAIEPDIIVFDASNSLWKIAKWKKECEALFLPCFSIPDQGAFVYNIE